MLFACVSLSFAIERRSARSPADRPLSSCEILRQLDANRKGRAFVKKAIRSVRRVSGERCKLGPSMKASMKTKEERAMSEVAYTSRVRIERLKGPLRIAYLPGE